MIILSFFRLAVLAVNAVSLDPHCKDDGTVITRKPPFRARHAARSCSCRPMPRLAHMVTTTDSGHSVVAIGLRDMIAMQVGPNPNPNPTQPYPNPTPTPTSNPTPTPTLPLTLA